MLKTVTVEIDEDPMVVDSLSETLGYIEDALLQHQYPDTERSSFYMTPSVFSSDPLEDIKKLKKFRKALKKVIDWYTP